MLLARAALAEPIDALDPAVQPFFARAEAEEQAGRFGQAAAFYRLVLAADEDFVPAELGLGRALEGDHQGEEAEALYRAMGSEPDAVEALARLVEPRDPTEALALWRQVQALRYGDPEPFLQQARLLAPTDRPAALEAWHTWVALAGEAEPDARALLVVAGEGEDGEEILRTYLASFPSGAASDEARARLDRLDLQRAAAEVDLGGDEPLTGGALAELRALEADVGAPRAALRAQALVADHPRSAAAHGLYADALLAAGAWAEAELEARHARRLAPEDARSRARLARIYVDGYAGRRDEEAVAELREAVRLRPSEPSFRFRLGRLLARRGAGAEAAAELEAGLRAEPEGDEAEAARALLAGLTRQPPPEQVASVAGISSLSPEVLANYRLARVLLQRGRVAEAVAALDAGLAAAPHEPLLLNARASASTQRGDTTAALADWRASLAADADQPAVWRNLGDATGDLSAWREAAARGDADAHYLLARSAAQAGDWETARSRLAAYRATAGAESYYREAAAELNTRVSRAYWAVRAGFGAAVALALVVPVSVWLRRRTARTLRDLLDQAPGTWHEAARVLAGLRHEVLKHNTTVLPDIAAALARGDEAPWRDLSLRLPELRDRFDAYLSALEDLGRQHRLRLDLRRRDPVLAPMRRELDRLARARRAPSPEALLAASEVINGRGYRALGRMVQEICVMPLTGDIAREVWARVIDEPSFRGGAVPALEVEAADGLALRMFRSDLEDILANLLRNALAAGAGRVGVQMREDEDAVTGHHLVEVAVWDDAPGALTNAMIRGRYIGRGLGLAVDLVNRHGGAIRAEPREGEIKAVVVQFPAVEAAAVEAEWTA
jgi:predicted Zn-dependent protease